MQTEAKIKSFKFILMEFSLKNASNNRKKNPNGNFEIFLILRIKVNIFRTFNG